MSASEEAKAAFDSSATSYNDYGSLPYGKLESELIKIALGDCTGFSVLDLGGGTGLHAREAISLGAAHVDIVDISPEMLKIGQGIEQSLGRRDIIRYFEGDVSKPLSHLPLLQIKTDQEDGSGGGGGGGYDVVMANWVFSYAETVEVLEGMFRNIVGYLKPGGLFVGVRDNDSASLMLQDDKYGASCKWIKEIPGGLKYYCVLHCTPPIEFETSTLEIIYSGSTELYERFGLTDVKVVPYEKTETVQKDPEFWKSFLEQPNVAVVRAVKKRE